MSTPTTSPAEVIGALQRLSYSGMANVLLAAVEGAGFLAESPDQTTARAAQSWLGMVHRLALVEARKP